jgi:hypothetical protein
MHEAIKKDTEIRPNQLFSISSAVFKRLQWTYLIGYLLAQSNYTILTQLIFTKTFFFKLQWAIFYQSLIDMLSMTVII